MFTESDLPHIPKLFDANSNFTDYNSLLNYQS